MRKIAPALALCLVSVVPVLAAHAQPSEVTYKACDRKATPDDLEAAKGLFKAGQASYNEGDYPKAIQYWRDAFERDCSASLLLTNLANAYEKAGNIDGAIVSLETYLKRVPNDPEAQTIQKRIENMRKAKTSAKTAPPPPTSAPTAAKPPPTAPTATGSATAPGGESKGPGIAPWIVTGVGGALVVVGGIIYLSGSSKVSDAEALCPNRNACQNADARDKGNSGRSQETTGGILAGVGLAGVAGGLAWYFLTAPSSSSSSAQAPAQMPKRYFLPEAGPGYAGAVVGGRF